MQYTIFGCKVNKFYTNKRLNRFDRRGFRYTDDDHLIATCVVTDRAKSKRLRETKKLLRDGKRVYLTGCGSFEQGEAMDYEKFFAIYPSLREWQSSLFLLGEDPENQTDTTRIGEYELNKEIVRDTYTDTSRRFTKKFLVIQSGCDTFCTFCLTIYKRGSHRSRTLDEIVDEVQEFVDRGGQEVVITGVNLAARGVSHTRRPEESQFSRLLEAIVTQTRIPRIRISSLGPEFLDDQFYELMHDERFLPHFHVSIQHFATQVLHRMNRNYDAAVLDEVMSRLRGLERPDRDLISIGGDLIVGFPGETQEDFAYMLDCVRRYEITKVHAFPFSPHQRGEQVPAGSFADQLPVEIKKERMQQLMQVADEVRTQFIHKNRGTSRDVLLESCRDGLWSGWTPNYIEASVRGEYRRGDVVRICLS